MLSDPVSFVTLLVEASLKGLIVLGVAAGLIVVLRRASAATRHWIWTLALGSMLAVPLLTPFIPAWQVPMLPAGLEIHLRQDPLPSKADADPPVPVSESDTPSAVAPDRVGASGEPTESETGPVASAVASDDRQSGGEAREDARPAPIFTDQAEPVESVLATVEAWVRAQVRSVPRLASRVLEPLRASSLPLGVWVAFLWLLGAGLALGRMVLGAVGVRSMLRRSSPVTEHAWLSDLTAASSRLALRRPVALRRSLRTTMPLTCGVLRPVILLPADYAAWSPARRRIVLLHELAHIRRRDCLTQRVGQLCAALYWFNPLVWVAVRWQRMEHERACDDLVLAQGTLPSSYAQELLDLARLFVQVRWTAPVTVSVARKPEIERRMEAILDPKRSRRSLSRRTLYATGLLAICLLLPMAALHLGSRDTATREMLASPRIAVFAPRPADEPPAPPAPPEPEGPVCEVMERTVPTADDVRIDVQNLSGSITVRPGPADRVAITAETCAPEAAQLEDARVVVDARMRDVILRTERSRHATSRPEEVRVAYLLQVPPGAHIRKLDQESGEVYLARLEGSVTAALKRGTLHAAGLTGAVHLSTIDAEVDLELDDRSDEAAVLVESVTGPVVVRMNRPVSAALHARSVRGPIETSFGLDVDEAADGRAVQARLGDGGAPLLVRTVDGGIRIEGERNVDFAVVDQNRGRSDREDRFWRRAFRVDDSERFDRSWDAAEASRTPNAAGLAVWNASDPRARLIALRRVDDLDEPHRTRVLSEIALHDDEEGLRLRALRLLSDGDTPATQPVLLRLLNDSAPRVRMEAARVLGLRRDAVAVDALAGRVRSDRSSAVRHAAVRAIGRIGDFGSRPVIEEALDDRDRRVRREAERVLREWSRSTWRQSEAADGRTTFCREGERECAEISAELRNLGNIAVEYSLASIEDGVVRIGGRELHLDLEMDQAATRQQLMVWIEQAMQKVDVESDPASDVNPDCDETKNEENVDRQIEAEQLVELQQRALKHLATMEKAGTDALQRIARDHPDADIRATALRLVSEVQTRAGRPSGLEVQAVAEAEAGTLP